MINLNKIKIEEPATLVFLLPEVERIIENLEVKEAKVLLGFLKKELADKSKSLSAEALGKYQELMVKLKVVTFSFIIEPEALELIQKYLVELLNLENVDLVEIIKGRLSAMPLWEDRDGLRKKILAVLRSNEENISQRKIIILDPLLKTTKELPATIANWLKDYDRSLGTGPVSNLKLAEYFSQNANFNNLTVEEKPRIKKLIVFYEYLKPSSFTPAGFEDNILFKIDEETYQVFDKGEFATFKLPQAAPAEPSETIKVSSPGLAEKIASFSPPSAVAGPKPSFYFHPEDEAESAKFKPPETAGPSKINWQELADEVAGKTNLNLADEVLNKRLKNVILSQLKDVRDKLETKDILMRSTKVGGLGLDENTAENIIKLVENEVQGLPVKLRQLTMEKVKEPGVEMGPKEAEKKIADRQQELAEVIRANAEVTKQRLSISPTVSQLDVSHELAPPPPAALSGRSGPASLNQGGPNLYKRPPLQPLPEGKKVISVSRPPRPTISPKPKMEDVKIAPKLMGPVEELRNLNLIDFRRLSNSPKEATAKIIEQINLLEADSFAKRLEGIKAWRESDLYRLYLEIGRQSIQRGCLVREIIAEREKNGQSTLTLGEFEAVMDLNKSLRF